MLPAFGQFKCICRGEPSEFVEGLPERRELRRCQEGNLRIVEADERYVAWHFSP